MMNLKMRGSFLILVIALLVACRENQAATPPPEIPDPQVLVSEVLTSVPGGNNREFIEIYNSGSDEVNLDGWTLWYLTRDDQEVSQVYAWRGTTYIPGQGHYLLIHQGESFELLPDAVFETPLFEGKGGLILRDENGEVADRLGWGEAPADYFAGSPIVDFEKGQSLERLPGGQSGSWQNSENNAADFFARSEPDPQNSGSLPTPLNPDRLVIDLEGPIPVAPGEEFALEITVTNQSGESTTDVKVSVPIAGHFNWVDLPAGATVSEGQLNWNIDEIGPGKSVSSSLTLIAPFANVDTVLASYYAESLELTRAYGPLQILQMDGSAIPIGIARSLPAGSEVTVEGIATMYTGGFFAGSSSAKFYIEDETGGIQVFADGGAFDVSINIGDMVRATGRTELFRDSLELIPKDNAADIQVLALESSEQMPTKISMIENEGDESILGRLNVLEGTAVRIDEFTYHYEIDLKDADNNQTLLYIEKDTGITTEHLQLGAEYRVTGISEMASSVRQLKPRLQSDIVEIFPPILLLEASGPTNIHPGEVMTVTITAVNHTNAPMTNVQISADNGDGVTEEWIIQYLDGGGATESVHYSFEVPQDGAGVVELGTISAVSDQWLYPAVAVLHDTYIGEGVPIWAIQGADGRSPLVGERVTAIGMVTGAFPGMSGFFLQSLEPDGDSATSDGIFVSTENLGQNVQAGEFVEVTGIVREVAGQTFIRPAVRQDTVVRDVEIDEPIMPVIYDPPKNSEMAQIYNESLEGMLVTIQDPARVIGPTNRYGEYILIYEKWDQEIVRRSDGPVGYNMWVDDGTFETHVDQTTLPFAVARGDGVSDVTGPLAYTFGNFKIAPVTDPEVQLANRPVPTIREASTNQFSVATFNVENLFDTKIPNPSDLPRLSDEEFEQRLNKVADAILASGAPTILAMQEVENIGVLEQLASISQLEKYDYVPVLLEGKDSRGIDVAYLVRGDRASVNSFAIHDSPTELFSRPPLVLTATIHLDSGDLQLILVNNHFLSLSAGETQTEPVRTGQAEWNVSILEKLRSENSDGNYIVLGDLNSFYETEPINKLQDSGLRHANEFFDSAADLPYTYIFEGAAQSIDHILMSESLFNRLTSVDALHINADYPIAHPDDSSPRRVSDHDPLVVVFTIE